MSAVGVGDLLAVGRYKHVWCAELAPMGLNVVRVDLAAGVEMVMLLVVLGAAVDAVVKLELGQAGRGADGDPALPCWAGMMRLFEICVVVVRVAKGQSKN